MSRIKKPPAKVISFSITKRQMLEEYAKTLTKIRVKRMLIGRTKLKARKIPDWLVEIKYYTTLIKRAVKIAKMDEFI